MNPLLTTALIFAAIILIGFNALVIRNIFRKDNDHRIFPLGIRAALGLKRKHKYGAIKEVKE